MSMTTSARSRSGPRTSRSARIPSRTRPSGASGWRRRVSLKRLTSVSSSASRKSTGRAHALGRSSSSTARRSSKYSPPRTSVTTAARRTLLPSWTKSSPSARDQPRRQVVDAEEAGVLEGGHRLGLAGPRVARDHEELDPAAEEAFAAVADAPRGYRRPLCYQPARGEAIGERRRPVPRRSRRGRGDGRLAGVAADPGRRRADRRRQQPEADRRLGGRNLDRRRRCRRPALGLTRAQRRRRGRERRVAAVPGRRLRAARRPARRLLRRAGRRSLRGDRGRDRGRARAAGRRWRAGHARGAGAGSSTTSRGGRTPLR